MLCMFAPDNECVGNSGGGERERDRGELGVREALSRLDLFSVCMCAVKEGGRETARSNAA